MHLPVSSISASSVTPTGSCRAGAQLVSPLLLILCNLHFGVAHAEGGTQVTDVDPCGVASPPAWCAAHEPSAVAYPVGTAQPHASMPAASRSIQEPPLFLVGSTLVAPPPVLWLGERPSDASRIFGVGEAASFVEAMELVLPSGWTIWTSEDIRRLNRVVGERVLWGGNGRPWTDVLESMAQQYGVEITADNLSRRAVVGLAASTKLAASAKSDQPGQAAQAGRDPSGGLARPLMPRSENNDANEALSGRDNPAYRKFVTRARLSVEPLPDTIGRIAWRVAPPEVQLDLTALGAYINAPVFQWDFGDSYVSPQAALEALMPDGYCLNEERFPTLIAVACEEQRSSGKAVD